MIRLLIVDDEEQIVDWLYDLFMTSFSFELDVYKAYSGSEALEWLNRTSIDIVLLDICMPGLDGFKLMEKIQMHWTWCRIIFLTGHNDFDYIYKAIKNNGVSYLLKSENDQTILSVVEKAAREIESETEKLHVVELAEIRSKAVLPILQKELLMDLLNGVRDVNMPLQNQLDECEIPLTTEQPLMLLIAKPDNNINGENNAILSDIFSNLKLALESRLPEESRKACVLTPTLMIWIFQSPAQLSNQDLFINLVNASVEHAQACCRKLFNITISVALTEHLISWESLAEKYEMLKNLIYMGIGVKHEMILTESNCQQEIQQGVFKLTACDSQPFLLAIKKIHIIEHYLEAGDKEEFYKLFHEIVTAFQNITEKHHLFATEFYYSFSVMLFSYINRMNLITELSFKIGMGKLFRKDEFTDWHEIIDYWARLTDLLFEAQLNNSNTRVQDTVSRITSYIKENIDKELSLFSLGEYAHFNPVYLSQLFKQSTGVNISDYIISERVKKAKALLESSNIKIYEIASAVGCGSSNYFTRMFKKETGITPQEYRLRYIRDSG